MYRLSASRSLARLGGRSAEQLPEAAPALAVRIAFVVHQQPSPILSGPEVGRLLCAWFGRSLTSCGSRKCQMVGTSD